MQVTFWGVRGSIPVPGAETARWGGNSSCVEVRAEGRAPVVLDCGTGARALGQRLVREEGREVWMLLSHLHVDHIFGFPFFVPLYGPGWRVHVGVPAYSADEAREKLGRYVNGTFHPTRLRDAPAELDFFPVGGALGVPVAGWDVQAVRLNHPGGSLGYRLAADGAALAYITDTAPFARPGEGVAAGEAPTAAEERVIEALRGCQTVVFDTMFDHDAYLERMTWGHAYPEYAIALCRAAGVGRLVLFHHLPEAGDDELDARAARYADERAPVVVLAREGETLDVATGACAPRTV